MYFRNITNKAVKLEAMAALQFCIPLCGNEQLARDQLHNIAVKSCAHTAKASVTRPFPAWGCTKTRNGEIGNEKEMRKWKWKWSSLE